MIRRSFITALILIITMSLIRQSDAEAQVMRDVMFNTGAGTVTGAGLGGAVMLLNNSTDLDPLRVGVGAGTLFGLGIGIYDAFTIPSDDDYYFDGVFASGRYRGTVILLDTFYGAGTGALVGTAISLIGGTPVLEGLRIGSGTGAFIGFGFGLFDAFVLGRPVAFDDFFEDYTVSRTDAPSGIISMEISSSGSVSFFDAELISYHDFSTSTPKLQTDMALWVSRWSLNF